MRPTTAIATMALALACVQPASAGGHDDFEQKLYEQSGEYARTWTVTWFNTFHVGPSCLAHFTDPDAGVLGSAALVAGHLAEYFKHLGADDWSVIESQKPRENARLVAKLMEPYRSRLHITVNMDGDDCRVGHAPWLHYWESIAVALEAYPPAAPTVNVVLNVSAKARTMTAEIAPDGTYVITAVRDYESNDWLSTMEAVFKKTTRKR